MTICTRAIQHGTIVIIRITPSPGNFVDDAYPGLTRHTLIRSMKFQQVATSAAILRARSKKPHDYTFAMRKAERKQVDSKGKGDQDVITSVS